MGFKAIDKEYNVGNSVQLNNKTARVINIKWEYNSFYAKIRYDKTGETETLRLERLEEIEKQTRNFSNNENYFYGWAEELNE